MKYPEHVLQSSAWSQFRSKWGTKVVKVGKVQFSVHKVPFLPWNIGYMPKVSPKDIDWAKISQKAKEENCIFVKIEPSTDSFTPPQNYDVRRGERMFAYATYLIDLKKSEKELLLLMHPKTRYNIGLSKRKEVNIKIGHTEKMLEEFLALFEETAKRQKMFNHPESYYKTLFSIFQKQDMVEIITAYYEGLPLASIMAFFYKDTMFYPYGGSTHLHKDKMAFYLVLWEAILLGKKRKLTYFDLWNCLTPEQESPSHPWYGFHRFKKGFGGEMIRFCGAYDLVLNSNLYPLLLFSNKLRWIALKLGIVLKKVIKRKS